MTDKTQEKNDAEHVAECEAYFQTMAEYGVPTDIIEAKAHAKVGITLFVEAVDRLKRLEAWKAEAVAFLKADVNCDCETGYLCSRCALLVE